MEELHGMKSYLSLLFLSFSKLSMGGRTSLLPMNANCTSFSHKSRNNHPLMSFLVGKGEKVEPTFHNPSDDRGWVESTKEREKKDSTMDVLSTNEDTQDGVPSESGNPDFTI